MKPTHTAAHYLPVALFFIALTSLSGCSQPDNEAPSNQAYYQNAQLISISPEQSYQVNHQYIGKISAKQQTNLSFEYAGKVTKILVDSGDKVTQGQVLAEQNTQVLHYQKAELIAQVNQAKAQISLNQANLSRVKALMNDGYASKQNLDELNAENRVLHAQINGLKARIQSLQYQIAKAQLVAPFNAVIGQRMFSTGEVVAAGSPVFRLIEQGNNEIIVGVPSKQATKLALGAILDVQLADTVAPAKIIAIGQQLDTSNRTVQLRLAFVVNNQTREGASTEKAAVQKKLASFNDQLVRVHITTEIPVMGFWLPIDAITDGVRGQWQVFLAQSSLDEKNLFEIQTATVNILHTKDNKVFVTGLALKPHRIISQGVHRFVSGQLVKARSAAKSSGQSAARGLN